MQGGIERTIAPALIDRPIRQQTIDLKKNTAHNGVSVAFIPDTDVRGLFAP
jgi:hypothetical protein